MLLSTSILSKRRGFHSDRFSPLPALNDGEVCALLKKKQEPSGSRFCVTAKSELHICDDRVTKL